MADLLFTTDLSDASKQQLRNLAKIVREASGKPIDLRKADEDTLRQYLQSYLSEQAKAETATEAEDMIAATAASVTDAIHEEPAAKGYVKVLAEGDRHHDPVRESFPPVEIEPPDTFSQLVIDTVTTLHKQGTVFGQEMSSGWYAQILAACATRGFNPAAVKEPLLLDDEVFFGLAGLTPAEAKRHSVTVESAFFFISQHLQFLQVTLNLSSLYLRHHAIRDKLLTTLEPESLLYLLPYDLYVLWQEVSNVTRYFLSTTEGYNLSELDDETLEEKALPQDFDLTAIAAHAEYASVNANYIDWTEDWESPLNVDPDEITLCLSRWDGTEFVSLLQVVARLLE